MTYNLKKNQNVIKKLFHMYLKFISMKYIFWQIFYTMYSDPQGRN